MRNTTVVLVIDDQPIFRAGVRRALSDRNGLDKLKILDCDPGKEGEEALRQIADNSPDVALLDVGCTSFNGLELSRYITRHFPATKVVALSSNYNADELLEVVKTGAAAYLGKDISAEELSDAIRRASSGEYPINDSFDERPRLARRVLEQFEDTAPMQTIGETIVPPLTQKEIQFLNLIAEDNSNRQIAAILGISERAIKNHVSVILRKLNASDKAHAVMLELCKNWLSIQNGQGSAQLLEQEVLKGPVPMKHEGPAKRTPKSAAKSQRRGPNKKGQAAVLASEGQAKE